MTDHGEIIFEVIGQVNEHGGATGHSVAFIELSPQSASLSHYHKIEEETYIIQQGTAKMIVDDQVYNLQPGEICLIKPGMVHQIMNEHASEPLSFIAICSPPWEPDDTFLK